MTHSVAGRGARRRRHRRRRPDGNRDHQPAGDSRLLGPAIRGAPSPRARLAGPPDRGPLRPASRGRATSRLVRERTGLVIDPYFSGDEDRMDARRTSTGREAASRSARSTRGSSTSSSGGHVTDCSNASRTLLFDIRRLAWDAELCDLLRRATRARSPSRAARPRSTATTREFGGDVPVAGIAGDQQAALFGQACTRRGWQEHLRHRQLRAAERREPSARPPSEGLLTTVAWGLAERTDYALEAACSSPGRRSSGCATGSA